MDFVHTTPECNKCSRWGSDRGRWCGWHICYSFE